MNQGLTFKAQDSTSATKKLSKILDVVCENRIMTTIIAADELTDNNIGVEADSNDMLRIKLVKNG
ncbi:MAG: hypothetical protein KH943_00285 [Haemophilus parahaemolyticus]|uniref:hypothetical protein n=1 Tax=Haemophilus parahaemolyticus TaxID=735 RepID=UPI0026EF8D43|nr:hypothetical protein [Haemophilus parahaemolyticus]MBS6008241.1 hypothetical protein [Haemophilus parahaemolyticus]